MVWILNKLGFKTRLYLRFKHGAAVHRVGRRSPLPLLSFALNFCNQTIRALKQQPSWLQHQHWKRRTSKQSLTFQVVMCYEAQRHHEGQFLEERNSYIIRNRNTEAVMCQPSLCATDLWTLLFLRSWRRRRQRGSGGGGEGDNHLLLSSTSWFNSLLRGEEEDSCKYKIQSQTDDGGQQWRVVCGRLHEASQVFLMRISLKVLFFLS